MTLLNVLHSKQEKRGLKLGKISEQQRNNGHTVQTNEREKL